MKTTSIKTTTLCGLVLIAISLTGLVNCSGVKFGQGSASSVGGDGDAGAGKNDGLGGGGGGGGAGGDDASGNVNQPGGGGSTPGGGGSTPGDGSGGGIGTGPGGTDVSNAGGPPGPVTGNGNSAAAILPKLQFIGPPCERLTNCLITFKLDKAYPAQTEFNWRTDDARFGTPPNPGAAMWGKAGYHYVSTSGHVVFPAGTTEQTVYVRNINPDNVEISIGVVMSQCTYNTKLESCAKFFGQ